MDCKRYLLLLALSKASTVYGLALYARLRRDIDPAAQAAWIDEHGLGVFIASSLAASDIWRIAVPERLPTEELSAFKDMLLLELGQDHQGMVGAPALAWLERTQQLGG
jgi:hypothetical protein